MHYIFTEVIEYSIFFTLNDAVTLIMVYRNVSQQLSVCTGVQYIVGTRLCRYIVFQCNCTSSDANFLEYINYMKQIPTDMESCCQGSSCCEVMFANGYSSDGVNVTCVLNLTSWNSSLWVTDTMTVDCFGQGCYNCTDCQYMSFTTEQFLCCSPSQSLRDSEMITFNSFCLVCDTNSSCFNTGTPASLLSSSLTASTTTQSSSLLVPMTTLGITVSLSPLVNFPTSNTISSMLYSAAMSNSPALISLQTMKSSYFLSLPPTQVDSKSVAELLLTSVASSVLLIDGSSAVDIGPSLNSGPHPASHTEVDSSRTPPAIASLHSPVASIVTTPDIEQNLAMFISGGAAAIGIALILLSAALIVVVCAARKNRGDEQLSAEQLYTFTEIYHAMWAIEWGHNTVWGWH